LVLHWLAGAILDFIKKYLPDTATTFTVDQILHVALLWGIAFFLKRAGFGLAFGSLYRPLVWVAGFVAVVQGR
jgi:hypothetical protein